LLIVSQMGCASSPALRAARAGDWDTLRSVLTAERAKRRLDAALVQRLAKAVASREIAGARGADAVSRIEDVKACTLQLRDALVDRAKNAGGNEDPAAGAATLALLDGGPRVARSIDRKNLVGRAAPASDPYWRAAAARASESPERRRFFNDPDERVRLAALHGALEKPSDDEREPLVEVARLDPNPLARSLAMRALGTIGGERIVLALVDLYERADSELRVSVVDAWAMPACLKAGSERHLLRVAQSPDGGLATLSAATTLTATNNEAASIGLQMLLRAASEGSSTERVLAIGRLPLRAEAMAVTATAEQTGTGTGTGTADRTRTALAKTRERDAFAAKREQVEKAIEKAASSEDKAVRIAALVRMAELPAWRDRAAQELRALSNQGSRAALMGLAQIGDRTALDPLRRELANAGPETRLSIGRALMRLGGTTEAADLLGDRDAHVRTSGACAILLGAQE
jgi:hypothetical protein